ncbi:MAG: STAS domain-containing protein [Pirellulaceae bacterium]|jgi:anti-sigma B factor antagonist|nr:STAS domain-containing protein [Pirellulaceae bacterium]
MTVYRRIETCQERGITVVTFIERKILEAAHILELGEELLQLAEKDENKHLLLDFSSVEFLSSAALNKLIILDKKVKSKSGQLKLCNMMPEIREVFVITRLNQLFDIVDTREKAMEGFQRANVGAA